VLRGLDPASARRARKPAWIGTGSRRLLAPGASAGATASTAVLSLAEREDLRAAPVSVASGASD